MQDNKLLTIPANAGQLLLEKGGVFLCHYLSADKFADFCKARGIIVNEERLLTFERLGMFSPVFRLRQPSEDVGHLRLPMQNNEWFERGWALDIAGGEEHWVPDEPNSDTVAYYSRFQIASLHFALSEYNLTVQMEEFLRAPSFDAEAWLRIGRRRFEFHGGHAKSVDRNRGFRPAIDLLCQYISDRYYPHVRSNMRTRQVSSGYAFDEWTTIDGLKWEWEEYAHAWKPSDAEAAFDLTPPKLEHAFRALASQQAWDDPLERWYDLMQFVSVDRRDQLRGAALAAETMKAGAQMLQRLHRDLYGVELPHTNETHRQIFVHMPELEARTDVRRHLEFVANRYDLNPRPKLTLFVEGPSEDYAVRHIFERHFGVPVGTLAIETIVLGGIDNATGTVEDRYRAILRLVDYLHHHQTFAFLILDNERHARKLKAGSHDAKSILHTKRYVTRPEYVKVWRDSFEFDNFSNTEIAQALSLLAAQAKFRSREVANCREGKAPGAALMALYRERVGSKLNKLDLVRVLVETIFSTKSRRPVTNRPIVEVLDRVIALAARNPFPQRVEDWEYNQTSTYLGKARGKAQPGVRRRLRPRVRSR
ncbi:hypothetical protein FJ936_23910 [Mesorhizobium sp. B2-4-13]|uniref:hypothetical protein n=1 Tax=Mesorhizobium sp. B2-4-13 TaxID=2589936 RepID=UPI00114FB917|nr:hypothetical protein [Mesorhizobium sp. B2-4-13]TPK82544.1 hypothetical protein FJ936_23910 [Mesorhizobium sp. B2-4-13]